MSATPTVLGEVAVRRHLTMADLLNPGRPNVKVHSDGWTAVIRDRSLSAQFERSIGVTETGCEVFTLSPKRHRRPPYGVARSGGA